MFDGPPSRYPDTPGPRPIDREPPHAVGSPDGYRSGGRGPSIAKRFCSNRTPPMDPLSLRERQRLDDDGYLAFEGLIDPPRVRAMRSRLEELLAVTEQSHAGTLIVGGLLDEPVFDAAWHHPRVLAAMRQVLGDDHRMLGLASRGLRPGHGQQALHVDWGGPGTPGLWYASHAICALVDFTEENGATRVLPGSHRNPWMLKNVRDPRGPHPAQRQLVGPAGTVFVLNIHCVHSAM